LHQIQGTGPEVLAAYLRNVRLELYKKANHILIEVKK
jgi:hypothetical protein